MMTVDVFGEITNFMNFILMISIYILIIEGKGWKNIDIRRRVFR